MCNSEGRQNLGLVCLVQACFDILKLVFLELSELFIEIPSWMVSC